jgi:hypothetical protein
MRPESSCAWPTRPQTGPRPERDVQKILHNALASRFGVQ